jgi:hypothetical protein
VLLLFSTRDTVAGDTRARRATESGVADLRQRIFHAEPSMPPL